MSDRPLTTKQRLFVEAYLANPNATDAARKAGYKGTDNALGVIGLKLLRNAKISEFVTKRVTNAAMSADEVLSELSDIARADWREFIEINYNDNGDVVNAKLKLAEKIRALELLGKHHQLFEEAGRNKGNENDPEIVLSQRELAMRIVLEAIRQGYSFADAVAALKSLDAPDLPDAVRNEVAGYLLESNEVN